MLAVFDIGFVFSCPWFVPDIQCAIERFTKNYEIAAHSGNHFVKNFDVDYFKNEKSIFVCCFNHLLDGMYFDTKKCCHYDRRGFFACVMIIVPIRLKSAINVIEEV